MKILKFDESFLFEVNPDTFEKNLVAAGPTGFTTLCIYARTLISRDKTLSQKEKKLFTHASRKYLRKTPTHPLRKAPICSHS